MKERMTYTQLRRAMLPQQRSANGSAWKPRRWRWGTPRRT